MPVHIMKAMLSVAEYNRWVKYFVNTQPDVTEIQLARLTLMVAQGLGAKDVKLEDFLINTFNTPSKSKEENEVGMSNEAVRNALAGIAIPLPSGK